jgi:hypothetical protein
MNHASRALGLSRSRSATGSNSEVSFDPWPNAQIAERRSAHIHHARAEMRHEGLMKIAKLD